MYFKATSSISHVAEFVLSDYLFSVSHPPILKSLLDSEEVCIHIPQQLNLTTSAWLKLPPLARHLHRRFS
ncbi:hypothetical protein VIGAN_02174400 [Vigna angularis var. angularis]|uniref:Uncharacterized protein n=1 Tax=Vigna angularis var. angularis TaxID=157739 RepID=A0A0S3RE52_PHAAN|nr:hypothetical protein VIGAN_02174400 [Vigna angularis var. angularis]